MGTLMEAGKQIAHSAAIRLGLAKSPAEAKIDAERKANQQLRATRPEIWEEVKAAAKALEEIQAKINAGDAHRGEAIRPQHRYDEARRNLQLCDDTRTKLFNTAPEELRIEFFNRKRELTSIQTRINLLKQNQIPTCKYLLAKDKEKSVAADAVAEQYKDDKDTFRVKDVTRVARYAKRVLLDRENDLAILNEELAELTEKLLRAEAELAEAEKAILEA